LGNPFPQVHPQRFSWLPGQFVASFFVIPGKTITGQMFVEIKTKKVHIQRLVHGYF